MSDGESIVIDGYDLAAECGRLAECARGGGGASLDRATARVSVGDGAGAGGAPVDLGRPRAGMFVASSGGTLLDLDQGNARRLVDERHPSLVERVEKLVEHRVACRREVDARFESPVDGLVDAAGLAACVSRLTEERFPGVGRYTTLVTHGGAESGETAIKLGQLHAYRRFVARHGEDVLARVMADLDIPLEPGFDADDNATEPLYADYPFVTFGCHGAFHGRTLGVLNLSHSRKSRRIGFGTGRWYRHIPFDGDHDDLARRLDTRPIPEILDAPGGVAEVIAAGRVPVDLVAQFAVEAFQADAGHRVAGRDWLRAIAKTCEQHDVLFGVDEVRSFGRTGQLFAIEHYGVAPDVVWTAGSALCGLTVARAELLDDDDVGRHAGAGLFDVNLAHAVIEALVTDRAPLFRGKTVLENSALKGTYMRSRLADLSARHADEFTEFSGIGGIWGLTVEHGDEVVEVARSMGLRLAPAVPGRDGDRIRLVLLADVLTREVDEAITVLDRVFTAVEERHADEF